MTQVLAGDAEGLWDTDRETAVGAGLVWSTDLREKSYCSVELVAEAERLSGARILSITLLVGFVL